MTHRRTSIQTFKNSSYLRKNQTEAENRLWQVLRAHRLNDFHFRRQHAIGPYIVDFCSPKHKIIIELDGSQQSLCAIALFLPHFRFFKMGEAGGGE